MSLPNLSSKVALVTGGSKGIGRATCIALSRAGANVVINYSSDSATADKLVEEIGKDKAFAVKADAGSVAGAQYMVEEAVKKFGKIDILIPNAGIMALKTLEDTTEEDFDQHYAINVKGPYFLVQKALPHMSSGSNVILVSTNQCHASTVTPPYLLYCSTKGAIEQMVRVLSKDFFARGIRVNAVAPGPTATDLFLRGKSEDLLKMISGLSPAKRIGEPDEVADALLYLAGEGSRWVTGQILKCNGGIA